MLKPGLRHAHVQDAPVEQDRDALNVLYHATHGDSWTTNKWGSAVPLGEWRGVGTNSDGGFTELYLGHDGLSGDMPRDLGSLTGLVVLNLSANQPTGEIPAELAGLESLQERSRGRA